MIRYRLNAEIESSSTAVDRQPFSAWSTGNLSLSNRADDVMRLDTGSTLLVVQPCGAGRFNADFEDRFESP